MIKGMTGFGTADFSFGTVKGTVEIKSVNHRYLDLAYFLPPGFISQEEKIRQILQKNINRGRITVGIKINKKETGLVSLNKDAVRSYLQNAKTIKKLFLVSGDLSLKDMMLLPGVLQFQESEINLKALWPAIEKSIQKALLVLMMMRTREGKSIEKDIHKQISSMFLQINKIRARENKILTEQKKKMSSEEFESYQKGIDVNEELERLSHHLSEFRLLVKMDAPVGKRLDFIAQEMQRETNTIGSKLQDKIVSSAVITIKSKIEKLREQAQNIE